MRMSVRESWSWTRRWSSLLCLVTLALSARSASSAQEFTFEVDRSTDSSSSVDDPPPDDFFPDPPSLDEDDEDLSLVPRASPPGHPVSTSRRLEDVAPPGVCGQMIKNRYGRDPKNPVRAWLPLRSKLQGGLPGTQDFIKSFRSYARTGIHSGPAQYIDAGSECFKQVGRQMIFTARVKLKRNGREYACSTSQWNRPNTCPLFSFRLMFPDNSPAKWFNSWNQGLRGRGWQVPGWNLYSTTFTVDADLSRASQLYFMMRGPPKGAEILLTNISLLPYDPPTNAPTTATPTKAPVTPDPTASPTARPTYYRYVGPDAYVANAGCELNVENGDFERDGEDPSPWTVNGGGVLRIVSPGDGGSAHALSHTGRARSDMGPRYTLNAKCLRPNSSIMVKARIKVRVPSGGGGRERRLEDTDATNATETTVTGTNATETESDIAGTNETVAEPESDASGATNETETEAQTETEPETDAGNNETTAETESDSSGTNETETVESESEASTNETETESLTGGTNETESVESETESSTNQTETETTTETDGGANETEAVESDTDAGANETNAETESDAEGGTTDTETDNSVVIVNDDTVPTVTEPYVCDPLGPSNASCPVLTLHTIYDHHGEEHSYHANMELGAFDANDYNDFQTVFTVSDRFEEDADTAKVHMYFERVPAGYEILLDDVSVQEFQPIPASNIVDEGNDSFDLSDCEVIVKNGDAELGDTSGWQARLGGHLTIRPEGADSTNYSFQHSARTSFIMGPRHVLKTECFTPNMLYDFEAKIKLLDEYGEPFACDKTHTWIDDLSCPVLTFQIENSAGVKNWYYFGNEDLRPWEPEFWNTFRTKFAVTDDMVGAQRAHFYIERPRAGVTLVVDQIVISRDCTKLIVGGDAEDESLIGWRVHNGAGGYVGIHPGGAGGSKFAYGHFGRKDKGGGPGLELDVGCLVNGTTYEFSAMLRLLDEYDNNEYVACNRYLAWGDPDFCPLMSITFKDGTSAFTKNYDNMIPLTFVADDWNSYTARFTVTEEMQAMKTAVLVFKGVRPGLAILYDDVKLEVYEDLPPPGCSSLVINGDFEDGDLTGWDRYHSGTFQILDYGAEGTSKSLLTVERTLPGAGPEYNLDTRCLVEGREYLFKAKMKLLDKDGNFFACDRKAPVFNNPLSCPYVSIHMVDATGKQTVKHHMDEAPSAWSAADWNEYSFRFTVSHELGRSLKAMVVFKGIAVEVGLVLDRVTLELYEPPTANCGQLVSNTNAELGTLTGWTVHTGGVIDIVEGGALGSDHAFQSHMRTLVSHGPMQYLPVECLDEGRVYDLYLHLKLLDENDQPFACDKGANWNTPLTCPLVSLNVHANGKTTRGHASNEYGAPWKADEFNQYHAEITITTEMAEADEVALFVQGPRSGVKILYDNVSMKLKSGGAFS